MVIDRTESTSGHVGFYLFREREELGELAVSPVPLCKVGLNKGCEARKRKIRNSPPLR